MPLFYSYFYRCCKALLPLLALVCISSFAQQNTLKNLVRTNGTEKLTLLEQWSNKDLFFSKPNPKIKLLHELEELALEKNDKITLAHIAFYRGLYVMAMDAKQDKKGVELMDKAIAMAEKNGQHLQVGYFKHSLGYYYFTSAKKPVEALQHLLEAHYIFDEIGYGNVYDASGILDRLGYVYYHLSNFNEAVKYFKLSLKQQTGNLRRQVGVLNSIGLCYRELEEPDSTRKYFKQSRHQAVVAKDTAWIGLNSGNIARQYLGEKSYSLAQQFMEEYYRCALAVDDTELVVEALTGLGDISLHSGKVEQALRQLQEAEELLEKEFRSRDMTFQNYVRKQYLFSVYARAWDARGNASRSLDYLKASNTIRDSIERRARLSKNTSILQMFEAEQQNNRLKLLREEKQAAEMMQRLYIFIGALLAIVIGLLYSRQLRERKIQKQKQSLLLLEKEMAERELKSSREQLEEYVRNLRQKAEILEKTELEMDSLRQQNDIAVEDEHSVLHKLRFATILTEEDWTKFKILFEKVHAGFFAKLKTTYPGLTPAETRLCSLIKLGFNSHEMAAMTGISAMSIKKNRQRLRKKINISKEERLEDLFLDF
ncbi:hypothetical protein ACI6PS_15000 [Flavobacterium sp. PLA-1-15]|uniref:hypothetical protein n=1 Tax=Flavobacterium sp. PLA-1-15 TaxID=3380533 RepID=UPI003B812CDF